MERLFRSQTLDTFLEEKAWLGWWSAGEGGVGGGLLGGGLVMGLLATPARPVSLSNHCYSSSSVLLLDPLKFLDGYR